MAVRRRLNPRLTRLFALPTHPLGWLRLTLALYVLYAESLTYHLASSLCSFPSPSSSAANVLVVADVQLIEFYASVWERIARIVADLHLRRSWRRVRAKASSGKVEAVVFLGDMLDDGRFVRDDDEYAAYADKFKALFALPSSVRGRTKMLYAVGNRDVGLGDSASVSQRSRQRFLAAFGGTSTNSVARIGNHTLVLLDAPGLVEEDYRRFGAEVEFEDWQGIKGGAIDFVKKFSPREKDEPVVLFTHIPLSRPDSASCGPLRERRTGIRRGVGRGYQNLIGKQTTEFVLGGLRPGLVVSADDMDYCEVVHPGGVREVTVKAFSLARGIRRPGFHMLSLSTPHGALDSPCFMPDARALYWRGYLPLLIVALVASIWYSRKLQNLKTQHLKEKERERSAIPAPIWSAASTSSGFGMGGFGLGETSPPHTPFNVASFRSHSRPSTPALQSSILLPMMDPDDHDHGHHHNVGLGLTLHAPQSAPNSAISPTSPLHLGSAVDDATSFLPAPGTRKVSASALPPSSAVTRVFARLRQFWMRGGRRKGGKGGGKEWWMLFGEVVGPALALWVLLALWTAW
ncbi:hypothetical protein EXIGLDRAFT_727622 [Exidia glandulosa HHB12029]|uniref:Calcineurin-like phosphoesterase domain-containing protein n=1 Tax=Exidia glandulosa HHB12029 TaxID=1314781 RepID=A0A165LZ79_EXIGL|nr:hypothetical protein EXIGLDRAFT_727622 [Exidia glandulosa HHB12029]